MAEAYNWPPTTYADLVEAEADACTSLADFITSNPFKVFEQPEHGDYWQIRLRKINKILCSDFMREEPAEGEGGN